MIHKISIAVLLLASVVAFTSATVTTTACPPTVNNCDKDTQKPYWARQGECWVIRCENKQAPTTTTTTTTTRATTTTKRCPEAVNNCGSSQIAEWLYKDECWVIVCKDKTTTTARTTTTRATTTTAKRCPEAVNNCDASQSPEWAYQNECWVIVCKAKTTTTRATTTTTRATTTTTRATTTSSRCAPAVNTCKSNEIPKWEMSNGCWVIVCEYGAVSTTRATTVATRPPATTTRGCAPAVNNCNQEEQAGWALVDGCWVIQCTPLTRPTTRAPTTTRPLTTTRAPLPCRKQNAIYFTLDKCNEAQKEAIMRIAEKMRSVGFVIMALGLPGAATEELRFADRSILLNNECDRASAVETIRPKCYRDTSASPSPVPVPCPPLDAVRCSESETRKWQRAEDGCWFSHCERLQNAVSGDASSSSSSSSAAGLSSMGSALIVVGTVVGLLLGVMGALLFVQKKTTGSLFPKPDTQSLNSLQWD